VVFLLMKYIPHLRYCINVVRYTMMKYIGIDYGTKKTGVAVSDNLGTVAFPRVIVPTDNKLIPFITQLANGEGVTEIIVGESHSLSGAHNAVEVHIKCFIRELQDESKESIIIHREDERYTSSLARAKPQEGVPRGAVSRRNGKRNTAQHAVDAHAAALILQSFLDKQKK
jgi:putative Holliday junction resolvase